MADPRDKAGASAPATLGEGCLARFDPESLSDEDGTEFPGAVELWGRLNPSVGADDPAMAAPADIETPAPRPTDRNSR
ncbi:hypothetical protein C1X75_18785 [Pseudomonas sp. FW305-17]|uniref:hypothetical protein n=1 Tax=Pseudomonas sp. GW531-E2 TaxID=2070679 RepID=UPI000C87EA9C|nr:MULTISPECIES: hypothetical protein [unclassified Pseudomonas]PMZ99403.1 hypothetical protein C1X79_07825 [Pseudomonas sp. FW305-42]PNA23208.1 hypothetical protein C1X78_14425 [Pseudomonas sp. MPR-R1B]PNB25788.1 hypothetical protein C1X80_12805 [Pseudomonas sp. DP16D-E2]PNB41784.1 hypothetical protein C1X75_18785 [Pseudomonas sp. FW305-17]PNB60779.1 hypothetical protein C1X77_13345 [Pseudomonas sp. GW531-E2]